MNYQKKRTTFFYLQLVALLIGIVLGVIIFIIPNFELYYQMICLSFVLIALLVSVLSFNRKYLFYDFVYKYESLLSNTHGPIKSMANPKDESFARVLERQDFKYYKHYPKFAVYYKFETIISKSKKSKSAIIAIVIEGNMTFNDRLITTAINDFEDSFYKTEKFRNHIILEFRADNEFNTENVNEAKEISFLKPVKNHNVILINVLFSLSTKEVYFLHSENHNPNHYYDFAVNQVKKLI